MRARQHGNAPALFIRKIRVRVEQPAVPPAAAALRHLVALRPHLDVHCVLVPGVRAGGSGLGLARLQPSCPAAQPRARARDKPATFTRLFCFYARSPQPGDPASQTPRCFWWGCTGRRDTGRGAVSLPPAPRRRLEGAYSSRLAPIQSGALLHAAAFCCMLQFFNGIRLSSQCSCRSRHVL